MEKDLMKKKIVKENMHLPPHEIKKLLKKRYPDITNEHVEKIISSLANLKENRLIDNEEIDEER